MTIWTDLNRTGLALTYVDVGPWRTRVLDAGTGTPLVLMHGSGGHIEAYARNVAPLAGHHRVVAFDAPGHGWTTTAEHDLEIDEYVEHLAGLLDALGIDRTDLSGESLGGWTAMRFAARHPDRVRRLVLNTPGGTLASAEVMERIRRLSQEAADSPTQELIRRRLEWLMADPASVTDELVRTRREIYAQPGFAKSMSHILCLQQLDVRRRNMIRDEELAAITAPTLVVWTSHDPSGPAHAGQHIAGAIPDSRFELIDAAGHWPQWEQAGVFNALVHDFLD
jgi:2-hydroxy-6-oxonona-2,4-dienedioate hydrolase